MYGGAGKQWVLSSVFGKTLGAFMDYWAQCCQITWLKQLLAKCQRKETSWHLFHKNDMAVNVYYVGGFHLFCLLFFCTMKTMSKKNGVGGGAGVLVWFFFCFVLGGWKTVLKSFMVVVLVVKCRYGSRHGNLKTVCSSLKWQGLEAITFTVKGAWKGWCWGPSRWGGHP